MATTPSIAMIPSGYKTGKLYSVLPTNGDGDFDFARSTTATRVNKDGLIETVGVNVPRLDYSDGGCPSLLLEPTRSNLLSYSEDFSGWNGAQFTTPNYAISPDGTQNASRLLFTGASQVLLKTTSLASGVSCSATFYVKGNAGETIQLAAGGIDTMHTLNGSWQRLETNQTSVNSTILLNTFGGSNARDLLVWGAQLEQGSYATSYIPTQGSAVTRVADSSSQTVPSGIIGQTEGTLFIEYPNINDLYAFIGLSINGNNNNRMIIYSSGNNILNAQFRQGAAIKLSGISSLITGKVKGALSFSSTESVFYVNGTQITVGTAAAWSGLNQVDFNQSNQIGAKVSEIKYYNTRLSNAELAALTTL